MRKVLIGIILFALLAIITNPNEDKHKEAAKREFEKTLDKELGVNGEFLSTIFSLEGKPLGTLIERENQYLYSTTILHVGAEKVIVGYGFFGFVIINQNALRE